MKTGRFTNREQAGRLLAAALERFRTGGPVILGLGGGGVAVGYEIAWSLLAPLSAFLVRPLDVPGHPGKAIGLLASGFVRRLDETVIREECLSPRVVHEMVAAGSRDLARRERAWTGGRGMPSLFGRPVILVDDGAGTPESLRQSVEAVRLLQSRSVVVALPAASRETQAVVTGLADAVVCLRTLEPSASGAGAYEQFEPVSDDVVRALLDRIAGREAAGL